MLSISTTARNRSALEDWKISGRASQARVVPPELETHQIYSNIMK